MLLSDNVSEVSQCWIDLVDKTLSNTTPGATARITPLVDNWVHVELTTAAYTNTTANAQFGVVSVAGAGAALRTTGSFKMWGGQVEPASAFPTSPILTSATSVSRSSDTASLHIATGSHQLSWLFAEGNVHDQVVDGGTYPAPTSLQAIVRRVIAKAI
jgi:hypothetical protein